jgi:hypothetical protein
MHQEDAAVTDTSSHPRVQPGRFQGVANRIARILLATPLLSRLVGRALVTIYVVGRKTGRRYVVPVAYTRHEGDLLIGAPFAWARNLRTGEPVEVRYLGRRRTAAVRVYRALLRRHLPGEPHLRRVQQDRSGRRGHARPGRPAPGLGRRRPGAAADRHLIASALAGEPIPPRACIGALVSMAS